MELQGQAHTDFQKWLYEVYFKEYYNYQMIWQLMGKTARLAVYVEWFDTVGFYIKAHPHLGGGQVVFYPSFIYSDEQYRENERNVLFDNGELYYSLTRQEATTQAIKHANEIYNQKQ